MIATYDIGDTIRIGNHSTNAETAAFANAAGTPTDPATVQIVTKEPDGTIVTYAWPTGSPAATKEATGRFYVDVTPGTGEHGLWHWKLAGTGTVQQAEQGAFYVRRDTTTA